MRKLFIIFVLFTLVSCKEEIKPEVISVQGSDTEIPVTKALAKIFGKQNADYEIQISGGGSGTGIKTLLEDKIDIANSSRPMSPEEEQIAERNGVEVIPIVFAVDAIAIIVNEANQIDEIEFAALKKAFSGSLQSWKSMGGVDRPIQLYGRGPQSGTHVYFEEEILQESYSETLIPLNTNQEIIEAVKRDPAGIGYVGLGYAVDQYKKTIPGIKILNIINQRGKVASPTKSSDVQSGAYPITRPLYQYLNPKSVDRMKEYINFILSQAGQQIVSSNGYYPISPVFQVLNDQVLQIKGK